MGFFQLNIAKRSGPPSRIPLPTGNQYVKMDGQSQQELPPPRVPSGRSGSRYGPRSTMQSYPLKKANAEELPLETSNQSAPDGLLSSPSSAGHHNANHMHSLSNIHPTSSLVHSARSLHSIGPSSSLAGQVSSSSLSGANYSASGPNISHRSGPTADMPVSVTGPLPAPPSSQPVAPTDNLNMTAAESNNR